MDIISNARGMSRKAKAVAGAALVGGLLIGSLGIAGAANAAEGVSSTPGHSETITVPEGTPHEDGREVGSNPSEIPVSGSQLIVIPEGEKLPATDPGPQTDPQRLEPSAVSIPEGEKRPVTNSGTNG